MKQVWRSMIQRCTNPSCSDYKCYGGRGIAVCDRWRYGEDGRTGFECFLSDLGQCPTGLTLERRDNDGNYAPSNCYWATRKEQYLNRRKPEVGKMGGRGPSAFKISNIKRAFTAAKKAGVVVDRVEVAPDGRIIIVPARGPREADVQCPDNPWDRDLAKPI